MHYNEIKEFSRKLRKNQTDSEALLWAEVRNRRLDGKKFTRQFPIIYETIQNQHFYYVADFYCHEFNLIVELDGIIHEFQQGQDKKRDEILNSLGFKILRIKNDELENVENVKEKIRQYFVK